MQITANTFGRSPEERNYTQRRLPRATATSLSLCYAVAVEQHQADTSSHSEEPRQVKNWNGRSTGIMALLFS
jgi:hypothetical protein